MCFYFKVIQALEKRLANEKQTDEDFLIDNTHNLFKEDMKDSTLLFSPLTMKISMLEKEFHNNNFNNNNNNNNIKEKKKRPRSALR